MENVLDQPRLLQKTVTFLLGCGRNPAGPLFYAKKRTTTAGFVQWVLRENPLRLEEIP